MGDLVDDDVAPAHAALAGDRVVAVEDRRGRLHAAADAVRLDVGELLVGERTDV